MAITSRTRTPILIISFILIDLILRQLYYGPIVINGPQSFTPRMAYTDTIQNSDQYFYQLALQAGTDKFHHRYDCLYEGALAPYRHRRNLKLLEIGLGCGMDYGPGASKNLWASYFSDVTIYIFEYNQTCGEEWLANQKGRKPIMTYGDQSNPFILKQMIDLYGPFDIIIDDGGHTMEQQINSFVNLFPFVTVGGTYFIEDLGSSFSKGHGGTDNGLNNRSGSRQTTIGFIGQLLASSIMPKGLGSILGRLTCCYQICGFQRTRPIFRKGHFDIIEYVDE